MLDYCGLQTHASIRLAYRYLARCGNDKARNAAKASSSRPSVTNTSGAETAAGRDTVRTKDLCARSSSIDGSRVAPSTGRTGGPQPSARRLSGRAVTDI